MPLIQLWLVDAATAAVGKIKNWHYFSIIIDFSLSISLCISCSLSFSLSRSHPHSLRHFISRFVFENKSPIIFASVFCAHAHELRALRATCTPKTTTSRMRAHTHFSHSRLFRTPYNLLSTINRKQSMNRKSHCKSICNCYTYSVCTCVPCNHWHIGLFSVLISYYIAAWCIAYAIVVVIISRSQKCNRIAVIMHARKPQLNVRDRNVWKTSTLNHYWTIGNAFGIEHTAAATTAVTAAKAADRQHWHMITTADTTVSWLVAADCCWYVFFGCAQT